MHLQSENGEEFEGFELTPSTLLVRGAIGGHRPEFVDADALLESAKCLTERRTTVRRIGPDTRRARRQDDRRGMMALYLSARGRRRADIFTLEDDIAAAGLTRRLQQRAQEQARQQRAG